ncbi:MAG TPA: bifunctional UDP-N-acetylglucosamine diphosphorylase/glucosamine-1-phosphate N-acetyltransferase GlmU, partial [Acidobacteriota bacterium]|nr:bifunctional UDP-N-acetylglucosamine diphosphorylase/glucosamine-1-phosphate N-acetyltransferase GlmU [Acidobacteriota bacterium]
MSRPGKRYALILAAGKGTRFNSEKPKVLHELCGRPMILYLLDRLPELNVDRTFIITGHGASQVREALADYPVEFIHQEPQLGTGHAVMTALPQLQALTGSLLVLYGDTVLVSTAHLQRLFETLEAKDADHVLLTMKLQDPTGYGRILRDENGCIIDIVEEKEASHEQLEIREINPGFNCFRIEPLTKVLPELKPQNKAGEYYLTDLVRLFRQHNMKVETVSVATSGDELGINDRQQLARAEKKIRREINMRWMSHGVTMIDPEHTYIDYMVELDSDVVLYPGVILQGRTRVGKGSRIGAQSHLEDSTVGNHSMIDHSSVIRNSEIGSEAHVGPFAHLRSGCVIGDHARVGNYVEMKNTRFGRNSKAAHLTYLGDAMVGESVNIGAGTITCNYDG